jgi:hypothetical protein
MPQHPLSQPLSFPLPAFGPLLGPLLGLMFSLLMSGRACAQDRDGNGSHWNLSGFGTIGAVHSSERNADYTSNVLKASGAGVTRPWSADVDSRLGVQLDLSLDRRWSAVLQVVSEQGVDNSYRPRVEWANVKYQATPELALRFGRIAVPIYLAADYRKVGYIYPWVRPPAEVYAAMPFTSSDGVDATFRWNAGPVRNSSQLFYGHNEIALAAPLRAYVRSIVGLSNTAEWGALSVRANLVSSEVTTDVPLLFDAFEAAGPAGAAIARRYEIDHAHAMVASIGLNYDPGRWFLTLEASRSRTGSLLLGAARSAYASAGVRLGAFTPYLSVAHVRNTDPTHEAGLPTDGLAPAPAAMATALNGTLNQLLTTIPQQSSQAFGLRWDLAANAALKLQYERVTPRHGSQGTLINPTPAYRSGHTAHVTSVALDFVY